ncbi:MAG: nucleotidyltransferase domain-containing protein [Pseudanabaena sp. CAN_BIN31]|nr:nucleotidyltransferase domain-containing protein [Pseudanabaena sp. CAN_BIN31]
MENKHITLILKELKRLLKETYGEKLNDVILFGSYARKTANQNSDIDILIVLNYEYDLDREIEKTSHPIADLSLEYDVLVNRLFMSRTYYQTHESALTRNIHQEGIRL